MRRLLRGHMLKFQGTHDATICDVIDTVMTRKHVELVENKEVFSKFGRP